MPAAPTWTQALARYPFAAALLAGWCARADELPDAYSAALDAALAAFDPKRPLPERYQQLCASRARLAELAAAGDEHIATQLLRLRVWIAFGEPKAAQQRCSELLEQRECAAQVTSPDDHPPNQTTTALRERPFLPSCARFDDCPPTGSDFDAWLSALLLETHSHLSAERRREQPQTELARLAQRRKLPYASIESERMLALAALRIGKKVTIKPGGRLLTEGRNSKVWQDLGQPPQTPAAAPAASPWDAIHSRPDQHRLLLITVDFPPYDGGYVGASIRMYTLANFLAQHGYRVYVYLMKNSLTPSRERPALHRDVVILNEHFPRPDFDPAFCAECLDRLDISTVLSSSPPLVTHLLAHELKHQHENPLFWLCDVRDIYCIHPMTKCADEQQDRELKQLEFSLMAAADVVTAVSTGMIAAIKTMSAAAGVADFSDRVHRVENGYIDAEPMAPQPAVQAFVKKNRKEKRIILVYSGTGAISGRSNQEPPNKELMPLLEAIKNDRLLSNAFAIVIQGRVTSHDPEYMHALRKKLKICLMPEVNNDQAIANIKLADIGVNVNFDQLQSPMIMGGKVYDYIANGLGLLLLYPTNADSLLAFSKKHENKPFFADIYDPAAIRSTLRMIVATKDKLHERQFTSQEAREYHRDRQYQRLMGLLPQPPAIAKAATESRQSMVQKRM